MAFVVRPGHRFRTVVEQGAHEVRLHRERLTRSTYLQGRGSVQWGFLSRIRVGVLAGTGWRGIVGAHHRQPGALLVCRGRPLGFVGQPRQGQLQFLVQDPLVHAQNRSALAQINVPQQQILHAGYA